MRETVFRASLAAYVALLVGPAGPLLPGAEWPLFAGGLAVGAVGGAIASRRIDPGSVLSPSRVVTGLALPLGWLIPMVTTAESLVDLYLSPWFAGACAAGVWLLVVLVAYDNRQRARIEALTEHVTFEAGPPRETHRQLQLAVGALLVLTGTVVVASALFLGDDVSLSSYVWLPALVPVWTMLLTNRTTHEVAVAEEGLRVDRTIHDWETVESYELTDEALTIARPTWYHSDATFAREDIDDLDTVVDALSEHAPRN